MNKNITLKNLIILGSILIILSLLVVSCNFLGSKKSTNLIGSIGSGGSGGSINYLVHEEAGDDVGNSIYVDSNDKIYVIGYSNNDSNGSIDMTIWRVNSTNDGLNLDNNFGIGGKVVSNINGYDEGNSIYVDSSGNIYVTGYSNNGSNNDMVI